VQPKLRTSPGHKITLKDRIITAYRYKIIRTKKKLIIKPEKSLKLIYKSPHDYFNKINQEKKK
jgi:hypothetical protein